MTITLESTTKIVSLNGLDCRVWEGTTSKGITVHAYIPRIAAKPDQDLTEFEADLKEQRRPSAEIAAIPARLIL